MEFMTIPELARLIGVPVETVRYWRRTGYGPKAAKIGKRVLYRRADVQRFLDAAFVDIS